MDSVRAKFPKNRIPKTEDAPQRTIDIPAEQDVDFEPEDKRFYSTGGQELPAFVQENGNRFR